MPRVTPSTDLTHSSQVHDRLLDAFAAATREEIAETTDPFIAESLTEVLEGLRAEQRLYRTFGQDRTGDVAASPYQAGIVNAA